MWPILQMNKGDVIKALQRLSATQERISERLDSLEQLRNHDIDKVSGRHEEIAQRLRKIDNYIDKQTNFTEFKDNHTRNIRQNIIIFGALVSMIVALTGWSFWEKGLYTPVPSEPIPTINANN